MVTSPERLEALHRSGLLRHDLGRRLDILCETASEMIGCPIAQINLLDANLQHTVGSYPPLNHKSIPIEESGCDAVTIAKTVVCVPDTRLHPMMCMRPFVTVAGMLAYLGVPILFGEQIVGSFCVLDYEPRDWAYWQIEILKGLASLTSAAALR